MNINVPTMPPKSGKTHSKNTSFTFMESNVQSIPARMQRLSAPVSRDRRDACSVYDCYYYYYYSYYPYPIGFVLLLYAPWKRALASAKSVLASTRARSLMHARNVPLSFL